MHANALRQGIAGSGEMVQRLTLQLYPEDLGQIEVQLRAANDQLSLAFTAREGATRELLETHSARLRQMFDDQGLNLSDLDVGGGGERDSTGQHGTDERVANQLHTDVTQGEAMAAVQDTDVPQIEEGTLHIVA